MRTQIESHFTTSFDLFIGTKDAAFRALVFGFSIDIGRTPSTLCQYINT